MDREKALDRIRKLLEYRTQQGKTSEGEIENALRHARKLMDEFDIEEHEALGKGDVDATKAAYDSVRDIPGYSRAGRLDNFMVWIATAVADLCDVRMFTRDRWTPTVRGGQMRQFVLFVGLPRDVAVAHSMFEMLLTEGRLLCKMRYNDARPKEYKGYMEGLACRLGERAGKIKEARGKAMAGTTAIILAKDALLERWIAEKMQITNKKWRSSEPQFKQGFSEGWEDGKDVSLDTQGIAE